MGCGVKIFLDDEVKKRFPDLKVFVAEVRGVKVDRRSKELEDFKKKIYQKIRNELNLPDLRSDPIIRAYRDFFWSIGIDPTKIRPAAEALIRRILSGRDLPTINTLVDAYNLASAESRIALAAFDAEKIEGNMLMRFAKEGEEFLGIGMNKPKILRGGEIVVSDSERLIAIYPYRDADYSKVTFDTENVYLMTCGVPGITSEKLKEAENLAIHYITKFCGGERA
ncbi:MAG: hypothetical protein J7L83_03270 [Thaumarchaeota archaeon]|nr:hypothetical protein [Nitrososphaerota archaeon]